MKSYSKANENVHICGILFKLEKGLFRQLLLIAPFYIYESLDYAVESIKRNASPTSHSQNRIVKHRTCK